MKSNKTINIILGLMCFALTLGICIQIKTIEDTGLAWTQSQEENELKDQVLSKKEEYEKAYEELEQALEELEEVRLVATEDSEDLKIMEEQIVEAEKIVGYSEVTGPRNNCNTLRWNYK